jgi:thiosulfate/3-mercaptopyruvate sulfurtransferase
MISPLIEVHELQRLEQAFIVDCRFQLNNPSAGYDAYLTGHIPGAHYLDLDKDLSGLKTGKNGRHPLPQKTHLVEKLAQLGLQQNQTVVVYDAQDSMFAARAWWLLRWLGHTQVQVLHGGLPAWLRAGLPLSTQQPVCMYGNFSHISTSSMPTIDVATLLDKVCTPNKQVARIIDARAPDRFHGENETLDAVGGHIPGAYNRYFRDNLTEQGYFKPSAQLREEWLSATQNQPVIHQCGSGVSACHNLLAMEIVGLPSGTLYPGSWSEWCADATRPVDSKSISKVER